MFTVVSNAYFIASASIPAGPPDFPFFMALIAFLISSSMGISSVIGMSLSAGGMSAVVSGLGLFKSSSKCSFHLDFCSSIDERTLPLDSFIGF